VLSYVVQANVGGKLAQIGSRLIDSASRKMADDFFSRFAEVVGGAPQPAAAAEVEAPAPAGEAAPTPAAAPAPAPAALRAAPPSAAPAPARGGLSPVVWVIGLAVVLAIVLYVFAR
jgi:hypothetical protein